MRLSRTPALGDALQAPAHAGGGQDAAPVGRPPHDAQPRGCRVSCYNATVYRTDPATGEELGVFAAEVDAAGRMLRSNWLQCTGLEGTPRYDAYLRRSGHVFRVDRDGAAGYRRRLLGLALPPAYRT